MARCLVAISSFLELFVIFLKKKLVSKTHEAIYLLIMSSAFFINGVMVLDTPPLDNREELSLPKSNKLCYKMQCFKGIYEWILSLKITQQEYF